MLTLTIKATTAEAVERLMKGFASILTPAEIETFKAQMQKEIKRIEQGAKKKK
jgi:uncharacterized small protein (DUF1192 family)